MLSPDRKRRVVRTVALTAGVALILVNGYVGSWMAFSHAAHHRYISPALTNAAAPLFEPIAGYCKAGFPGAATLGAMWWKVNPPIQRRVPLIGVAEFPAPFAPPRPEQRGGRSRVVMLIPVEPGGCR